MSRRPELVPWETLHAYAAGELASAEKTRVEAALLADPENRKRLDKVRSMRGLLTEAAPHEPDDLAWKRLQQRVQAKLAEPAPSRDTKVGVWLPIGIAAAAVIAAVVLIDRKQDPDPIAPTPAQTIHTQVLASGSAPLDVTLQSGTSLHLAPS